jgi:hypothetical protein
METISKKYSGISNKRLCNVDCPTCGDIKFLIVFDCLEEKYQYICCNCTTMFSHEIKVVEKWKSEYHE